MKNYGIIITTGTFLLACGNPQSNNSSYDYLLSEEESMEYDSEEERELVTCPMCNGTGIFDFMPGDLMAPKQTCNVCDGEGVCNLNTAQQVLEMINMLEGNNCDIGYRTKRSSRDIYEIEYELNKAHELLLSLEEEYANSEGIVMQSQYPRMIEEQRERIRQLEVELANAE